MSSILSSTLHINPPSIASTETAPTEHDDVSVTASDDVDITSTSTTSIPEQDPSLVLTDETKSVPVSSIKAASQTNAKGPVTLLRRQPTTTSSTPQSSRQATPSIAGDITQPSTPSSRADAAQNAGKEMVDPALLEAFANPMNRQYLLQLEASLNNFVSQARVDTLELPQMNSFFRCLAHKMADHYKLQHVAESGRVVLFRSPYARIPETALSELSKSPRNTRSSTTPATEDAGTPPTITPEIKQIMRRVPRDPAHPSGAGEDDTKSESSQSQILSHEERQAVYEKTRARIFSDYMESQGIGSSGESMEKGMTPSETGSDGSSMRREKSLHRSDSFQTRLQFLREQAQTAQNQPYSSYAAALASHQQAQQAHQAQQASQMAQHQPPQGMYPVPGWGPHPQGVPTGPYPPPPGAYPPNAQVYPPPGPPPPGPHPQTFVPYPPYQQPFPVHPYAYPPPAPHMAPPPQIPREQASSRPDSQASSPPVTRNHSPGFQPNPNAREFVPLTNLPARNPSTSTSTPITPSRNPSPPLSPPQETGRQTPVDSPSASVDEGRSSPTSQSGGQAYTQMELPVPPPALANPQTEFGNPITSGTMRFMHNGIRIAPIFVPYKVHQSTPYMIPNPAAQRGNLPILYSVPFPQELDSRNGLGQEEMATQVLNEESINVDPAAELVQREGEPVKDEENSK